VIAAAQPAAAIYNLGGQSFVATSFEPPATTSDIAGVESMNILEVIRILDRRIPFYQAASGEMRLSIRSTTAVP
jgi:GDPmannose 4,6-dehydratase